MEDKVTTFPSSAVLMLGILQEDLFQAQQAKSLEEVQRHVSAAAAKLETLLTAANEASAEAKEGDEPEAAN